jgi:hypothetical protein
MSANRIYVLFQAKQVVTYERILSFTPEEWDEFKEMDPKIQVEELTGRLDISDVFDGDTIEDFFAAAVKRLFPPENY